MHLDEIARMADALWRAITYVAVAQLHLQDNPLLTRPLSASDTKEHPTGHWGTVPGTAWALTHIALARLRAGDAPALVPVIGAGHAGVAQAALAWLTGDLAQVRPRFTTDEAGLRHLVRSFPDMDGLGAEVSPLLPGGLHLGGQLGAALAFAHGAALDAPNRIVIPILGDGECETPTTAASWLAAQELRSQGRVLPIVHLNGYRMGGASLLGAMDDDRLRAYAHGLGWDPRVVHVGSGYLAEHVQFHLTLADAVTATEQGRQVVVFLRCVKGWSGPEWVGNRQVSGTWHAHKTPIRSPRTEPVELSALREWMAGYRPQELFTPDGKPRALLANALRVAGPELRSPIETKVSQPQGLGLRRFTSFTSAVADVVCHHAEAGDLRVFSPDELHSNRLDALAKHTWAVEVLAEEVLLGWLCGWIATGRRGLLISYEAFAPLMVTGVVQHLKQRRMLDAARQSPSLNLLLTSYGWQNVFTHGDPSFTSALLAVTDPAVRLFTPADPTRLAAALDEALCSVGAVNVIVSGKHEAGAFPLDTVTIERANGLAIWPHLSDEEEPDLVLVACGDLPAKVVSAAAPMIRRRFKVRVRVVAVYDMTVLGEPGRWPKALTNTDFTRHFGTDIPLLITTVDHPAAVWGLLAGRTRRPVTVIGWREPDGPLPQRSVAHAANLDVEGLLRAASKLLSDRERGVLGEC